MEKPLKHQRRIRYYYVFCGLGQSTIQVLRTNYKAGPEGVQGVRANSPPRPPFLNRQGLLPVNWQQRIYVKIAAASFKTGSSDFNVNSLLPVKFLFLF